MKLDAPVTDFYRVFNRVADLENKGQHAAAMADWEKAWNSIPRRPRPTSISGWL